MIRAFLFDLDGLLIDSEPYWNKADDTLLRKYGYRLTEEVINKITGSGVISASKSIVEHYNLPETIQSYSRKRYKLLLSLLLHDLKLLPYAKNFVEKIHRNKFAIGLATGGHRKKIVIEILKKLSIRNYFQAIATSYEVKRSKPYPDIYLTAAKQLNIKPSECLVLEDAINGVLAGKAAGMKVVGVNSDLKLRRELKRAGADFVYKNLNISLEKLVFGE